MILLSQIFLILLTVRWVCRANSIQQARADLNELFKNDVEYFEGLEDGSPLNEIMRFAPANTTFWSLAQILLGDTKISYSYLRGNNLPGRCANLMLDSSQMYHVLRPKIQADGVLTYTHLKFPFSSVLASNTLFMGRDYCIAFNLKNYGFGFEVIKEIPTMMDGSAGLHFYSISLSTENKLSVNPMSTVTVFDGMRHHSIAGSNQFLMKFELTIPYKAPPTSSASFYAAANGGKKGFHVRMNMDLDVMAKFNEINSLYFKLYMGRLDLFYNKLNLLTFHPTTQISGVLRDAVVESVNTCFPSGVFISSNLAVRTNIFGGLFGIELFSLKGSVDAGIYLNMRKFQNNGLFLRGYAKVKIFCLLQTELDLEFQKVNRIEIERRARSMNPASYCLDYEMTPVTRYILNRFQRYERLNQVGNNTTGSELAISRESDLVWNRFFQSLTDKNFYTVGYFKVRGFIRIPLISNFFIINGYLDGVLISPNPRNRDFTYFIEMNAEADILHLIGVGIDWTVNDAITEYKYFGLFLCIELGFHAISSSDWLYQKNYGTLVSMDKKIKRISIKPSVKCVERVVKSVVDTVVKVGETLVGMWNGVMNHVKDTRDEMLKFTNNLCFNPPCALSKFTAYMGAIITSGVSVINQVFGKTKVTTTRVGTNEWKCPIWEQVKKKCLIGCTVVSRQRFDDKPCMDQVQIKLLYAKEQEELADYKENVVEMSMENNMGVQFALDEIEEGRDFLTADDVTINQVNYDFEGVSEEEYIRRFYEKKRKMRKRNDDDNDDDDDDDDDDDPNDTSFIDDFDAEPVFPFDETTQVEIDESTAAEITQDLNLFVEVTINTKRLASRFKGLDNITVNLTIPANFDFRSGDALEKSIEIFYDQLMDKDGPFFRAIMGNNEGVSETLSDVFGMRPPVISLQSPRNPTIFCDDPEIDPHYNVDDELLIEGLRKHLTPIKIEEVWKSCRANYRFMDIPECEEDEEVCGASICKFTRFIYDGCNQISNLLTETIRVLPRRPTFRSFPENIAFGCSENLNVTQNLDRFVLPTDFNPGCRGVDVALRYEDELVRGSKCSHTIYRTWWVERDSCEPTLFSTRVQRLFVEDREPPQFSEFPSDRTLEFFESYGTEHTGTPKIFDGCGHGPSKLVYSDKVVKMSTGEREIERTWTASDACGNSVDRIQKIRILPIKSDLNSDFSKTLMLAFNEMSIDDSIIMGQIGAKEKIILANTEVGNEDADDFKCVKQQRWMVQSGNRITLDESTIYGPMKQLSDFKYDEAFEAAVRLSKFLNDTITAVNIGPSKVNCYEHSLDHSLEYPIENYLDSECSVATRKEFLVNTVDESMIDEETKTIELKGSDLLYNVFYFKSLKLFEAKTIRVDVPDSSFVIINFENSQTTYLNNHLIEFPADSKLGPHSVIFNFLQNNDVVFDFEHDFDASVLAPYSNFYAINAVQKERSTATTSIKFNGQIFAKNIYAKQMRQTCTLFESLL